MVSKLFADIFVDYIIFGEGPKWKLVADDEEGEEVTLSRENFQNISQLKDVDLSGLSFGGAIGWRF
jgi:hypothetical protein